MSVPMPQPPAPIPQLSPAATYWGQLLTASGAPSPIVKRFLSALFTFFDRTVEPRHVHGLDPFKVACAEEAMGVTNNDNVILELMESVMSTGSTIANADALVTTMYRARGIEYLMATRRSSVPVWDGMPVLTPGGFETLHMQQLALNPRQYWEGINKVLQEMELVDPETGVGFRWKTVPWECCPQEPVDAVVQRVRSAETEVLVWYRNHLAEQRALQAEQRELQDYSVQQRMINRSVRSGLGSMASGTF